MSAPASQWVSDVKSFAPVPVPILPYVISGSILFLITLSFGTYCCKPSGSGIEVTDTRTGKKETNYWLPWVFFILGVTLVPYLLTLGAFKLHFMINNPKFTASTVGAGMIVDIFK